MKKLRVLKEVLVRTKASHVLVVYTIFVLCSAFVIFLVEPNIDNYGDALWYCYAVLSTTGFGDVKVTTTIVKILSLLVTIYSTLVIAIVTGVVVNFYTEIAELQRKETFTAFMDKLEHLGELSKDELKEISDKVTDFRKKIK